tara:strand:- start:211 stop:681 length:471 start_codon:yes stop_codon:yes gene_type:complete
MDPISLLASIKAGISAGKTVAGLSKQIGQFFDATDNAKKKLQKKGITTKDARSEAFARWETELKNAQAEQELKDWICDPTKSGLGPSHWNTLLKIRREVLAEKREAERLARREAQERADLALTLTSIVLLILASFIGSTAWLHHKGWINIWDYWPW